jgi:O-antigen/teichoic acid export membrane protein
MSTLVGPPPVAPRGPAVRAGPLRSLLSGNSLRSRFARGVVWSLGGAVISQGLTLAASVVVARILGARVFGELGMIQSTVGMFGVFAGMGLGMTATKYIAELRQTNPERAGRILTLTVRTAIVTSGGVALFLFFAAPLLAIRSINAPHLVAELKIASGLLFLNGVTATQTAALAGFEAFHRIAKVNLLRGLAMLPISICAAAVWGLRGAVWALVAAAAIAWLAGRAALSAECANSGISAHLHGAWRERSVLRHFSAPAFLSGTMVTPVTWLANAILVNQRNGYWEMGIFNAANQWRTAISFVPGILTQPTLPILSSLSGPLDLPSYRRLLWGTLLSVFLVSTLMGAVVIAASPWILTAYGRDFRTGVATLRLLAVASIINCTAGVIGQAIASSGRMWAGFLLNLLWAAAFLTTSLCLVPRRAAEGLAMATLGSYSVHAATVAAYTRAVILRN